jgi:hypothetical protein
VCGSKSMNITHTENSQMVEDTGTRYIKLLLCSYEIFSPFKKSIKAIQSCQPTMFVKCNIYMYFLYSVHIQGHLTYW